MRRWEYYNDVFDTTYNFEEQKIRTVISLLMEQCANEGIVSDESMGKILEYLDSESFCNLVEIVDKFLKAEVEQKRGV